VVIRLTQSQRREQTRRALLDAARSEFGANGFAGATLDDIAAGAGVTRGALYYNFPSGKEDLFLALLDERLRDRADAIRSRIGDPEGPRELVGQARAAADESQAAVAANREWQLLTFEFALHAARNREFAECWVRQEATIRGAIEEVIAERAAALGGEPAISPEHLAIALNALGIGLALDVLVDEANVPEGLFGEVVGLLVRGLIAEAQDSSTTSREVGHGRNAAGRRGHP
jgi:AcrR family transcriptional regulator